VAETILKCSGLGKTYQQGDTVISVLDDINLEIHKGESIAIMGASGSGKSTFLNLLGGLDQAGEGSIEIAGENLASLDDKILSAFRNRHIGFVYQLHHLLMEFSALENVMMPLLIAGESHQHAEKAARDLLARVGLEARLSHRPSELSGGERQRVAIARALVMEPDCVLMDEPTGNLDGETAEKVFALILQLQKDLGLSFVIVTHDQQLADQLQCIYQLKQGKLSLLSAQPGQACPTKHN